MVHRDIKPSNLILDLNNTAWVTDFGLAKLCDPNDHSLGLSRTGDMIGTPRYMAPEQIRGHVDERSDVYSLGVTLWELATQRRAWSTISDGELPFAKSSIQLPSIRSLNRHFPEALACIIEKACSFDPDQRYQSAMAFQQALNHFLECGDDTTKAHTGQEKELARYVPLISKAVFLIALLFVFAFVARAGFVSRLNHNAIWQPDTESVRAPKLEFTGNESTSNVLSTMFIELDLPIDKRLRDGVFARIAGGRDADKLVSTKKVDRNELLLMMRPGTEPFSSQEPLVFQVDLEISNHSLQHSASLPRESSAGLRQLAIMRCDDDDEKLTIPLDMVIPGDVIDVTSADGHTFFALCDGQEGLWLIELERNGNAPFKLKSQISADLFGSNAQAIATADGSTFYVIEQAHGQASVATYVLDRGVICATSRIEGLEISTRVESWSTIDGKFFSIFADGDAGMLMYKGGLFDESSFGLSKPTKVKTVTTANATWLEKSEDSESIIQAFTVRLHPSSGRFHLSQVGSQRYLAQDAVHNLVTSAAPNTWRYIFVGESPAGNPIVNIRDEHAGLYVDEDDKKFNVDLSPNTGSDKKWEVIPAEDGAVYIRNQDSGAYLHEDDSGNVNTTHRIGLDCRWNVTMLEKQNEAPQTN